MNFCTQCNKSYDKKNVFCPIHGCRLLEDVKDTIVGRLIDNKYLIEEEIGEGGTGTVYRARHIKLELTVAIKILHQKFTDDTVAVERFRREAYASMQIRHPNAIAVMDFGITEDNMVYVVMELLIGISLRERLEEKPVFNIEEANTLMQPICEAVSVAHRIGIVHRDLKPENIFLDRNNSKGEEVVKVLDFGIARMTAMSAEQQKKAMRLTQEGILIGTPHYMSPEQCYGRDVDARSDIYALGIMLYEMITGQLPFDDRSLSLVAVKQAREIAKPTYEVRPGIPPIVNAVVMHAIEKKPDSRPPNVLAFAQELQSVVRMVHEKEFQSVFLNASDADLDAALLLGGNPASSSRYNNMEERERSMSPDRERTLSPEVFERLRNTRALGNTFEEIPMDKSSASGTGSLLSGGKTNYMPTSEINTGNMRSLEIEDLNDLTIMEDSITIEGLYDQMLHLTRETPILMQIMANDLELRKPLDMVFIGELKTALDKIRKIIFQLESIAMATGSLAPSDPTDRV